MPDPLPVADRDKPGRCGRRVRRRRTGRGRRGAVPSHARRVAHDCGLIINPDGLRHQIEGNVIQGISRTLKEEVAYTGDRVTTTVWQAAPPFNLPPQYEVARFTDVPPIECILIDRPDEPALGAGEPTIGTVGAAIANAVFAAVGARVRRLPMTPARVLAALAD